MAIVQAEEEYAAALAACGGEDFSDLDQLEFLQTGMCDADGRPIIVVIAKHYPAKVMNLDRVYR